MEQEQTEALIREAVGQMKNAYAPYSGFCVGAALLTRSGKIYTGCNIENAAASPGLCAERTAFAKAVSEGEREFDAICIAGGQQGVLSGYTAPCGVCRQVMQEFCDPETFQIILTKGPGKYQCYSLAQMLPMGFGPEDLA